jgi:PAS domain S-box-containing protein
MRVSQRVLAIFRVRSQRLILAVIVSCLGIIALVWALTAERLRFEHEGIVADAKRANNNLAIAYGEHTRRTIKGIDQTLQFIRHKYGEAGRVNIRKAVDDGEIDDSIFTFVGVYDEHGDLLFGSEPFKATNVADREYFKALQQRDGDDLFIAKPVLGRVLGRWAFPIARRISKPSGAFGGVVLGAVDPDYFTHFYREVDLGQQGLVTLVGTDGISRARRVGERSSFGEDLRASNLLAHQAKSANGSFLGAGRVEGIPHFISYRTLKDYPLIVAVGTSETELLTPFRRHQREYALAATLASIFVVLFGFLLVVALRRQYRDMETHLQDDARFRATFDQGAVGILHADLKGRVIRANRAFCAMLGYTEQELLTRTIRDITDPEDFAASHDYVKQLLSKKDASVFPQLEKRYVCKDGSTVWALVGASLVRDANEKPSYFITLVQDVSARKHAQEALETNNAELERSNRDLRQFTYAASHDLKTPLRAIGGFVGLLEAHYATQLSTQAADWIHRAAAGAKRLDKLIDDLQSYARLDSEAERFASIDCRAAIDEATELLQAAIAEADAEVSVGELPVVVGNRTQLVQLFQNLLGNAIKYRGEHAPRIRVAADLKDSEWVFSIADNGIGIDPKHHEQIFEVFRRLHTQDAFPGTGIGLAVCRRIVQRHGGRIWVESERGKGSTFLFTIPDARSSDHESA